MWLGCRAGDSGDGRRIVALSTGTLYLDSTRHAAFTAIMRQNQRVDAPFEGCEKQQLAFRAKGDGVDSSAV